MSQGAELFIMLAQIGGVFVGFGALISVTRRADVELAQLGSIRAVVTTGLVVIVASLVPVAISRYDVDAGTLWFLSSLIFLALSWGVIILAVRAPSSRELIVTQARDRPVSSTFFWLALELPIQVPLVLAVLGVFPDLAEAFYVTALVFNLFEAAFVLAQFVYAQADSSRR